MFIYLFTTFAASARAQFYVGPIASGAGGAGRAAVDPSESSFLNPAALSHIRGYNVSLGGALGSRSGVGNDSELTGLIADGNEDRIFPGSLSFVNRFVQPPAGVSPSYTEQDYQISGSHFLLHDLSIGFSVHRQLYQTTEYGQGVQDNGTVGLLYVPTPSVGVGFVAYDFVPSVLAQPVPIRQTPTYAIAGNYLVTDLMSLRLDVVRPTEGPRNGRNNVSVGLLSQFRQDFVARLGTEWYETQDQTLFTAGLGFHGPRLCFDYAFQTDMRVGGSSRHMIDLWLPL